MITAAEARFLADEASASVQPILDDIFSEIDIAAREGLYELSYKHSKVAIVVDNYRHNPSAFQDTIVRQLKNKGFFASVERESVFNSTPGPVRDLQYIKIEW